MLEAPLTVLKVNPDIAKEQEERKNWALLMMFGGAVVMTIFAAVCLYWVRANPEYVFYFGLAAHVQILAVMTGFISMLTKRSIKLSRDGLEFVDQPTSKKDLVAREDVDEAIDEVPAVVPEKK